MKLLLFTQDLENCRFCKIFHPVAEKLGKDYDLTEIQAFTPEGTHNPLNAKYDVRSTPTTIVLDSDGNELERFGAIPYKAALDKIKAVS